MRNFFSRLAEVFQGKPRKGASPPSRTSTEYGFRVFQQTGEVIRAERILREAGFAVEVKGPPPELRTGCDMIIVFDLMQEPLIRNALGAARLEPIQSVPMRLSLIHICKPPPRRIGRRAQKKRPLRRSDAAFRCRRPHSPPGLWAIPARSIPVG